MLDYLAHTPTPVHADFDVITMFEEVKAASLLDINYCGSPTMHADCSMMFRIMLNLGRNAGTAGASALTIGIWRAGHLVIMDVSDDGSNFRIQFHCLKFPEMEHEGASANWPPVPIGGHTRTAHQPS